MIKLFLTKYRTEVILFTLTAIVRVLILFLLLWWSGVVGDFDNHPASIFPVFAADSYEYYSAAQALLSQGSWSTTPEIFSLMQFRTPGYPLFLAVILRLFGNSLAISFAQTILAGFLAILIYQLGKQFFSARAGWWTAVILALEPIAIFQSIIVLSDLLFTFCLTLALWLCIYPYSNRVAGNRGFALAGFLLGYAALVRPIGQWLVVPFLILGVILIIKRVSVVRYRALIFFTLAFVATISPWLIRNYELFSIAQLSSFGPYNIYEYNIPLHYSYTHQISVVEARELLHQQLGVTDANFTDYKTFPRYRETSTAVSTYVTSNFFSFSAYHLFKTIPFFLTDGYRELVKTLRLWQGSSPNLTDLALQGEWGRLVSEATESAFPATLLILGSSFWFLVNLFMLLACIKVVRRGDLSLRLVTAIFLVLVAYFALLTGPAAQARYRLPVAPLMLLLAVYGYTSSGFGSDSRLQRGT